MKTDAAILADIIANPEDDVSRLVYADWLDENGDDDRAEFIRSQIRLAGMEAWDEGFTALDVRCRQLQRAHPEWLGPLGPFVERSARFCGDRDRPFRRGFPARVELTTAQFIEHGDHLLAETPVRDVLFKLEGDARKLARRSHLPRLNEVEFAFARDPAGVRCVLACLKRFAALRHFGILGSILSEQSAGEVFAAPALSSVRSLTIMGTRLPPSVEATIASLDWPELRCLVRVWVSQLDWLRSPWVHRLEELTIYDTEPNLTVEQRGLLADVLPVTAIRRLTLGWWELDAPGGKALGEAVAKSSVRSLALAQTQTPAEVANALLTPESLDRLHALYFSWAALDPSVIGRLLGSRLRVCALDHVTVESLAALEVRPGLPELADLRLGLVWRHAKDPFAERLCAILEAGTLPRLVSLTLDDTTPEGSKTNGDRIASMLASQPAIAGLRELQLPTVTRTGAHALAASPYLDAIQLFDVSVWPRDEAAELALAQRFGARAFLGVGSREY